MSFVCLVVGAPSKPQIPDVFQAEVSVQEFLGNRSRSLKGGGLYAFDVPKGRGRTDFRLENEQHDIELLHVLDRYDLSVEYVIDHATCQKKKVSGELPNPWGWVSNATYDSSSEFQGRKIDTWQWVNGNITRIVSVLSEDVNVPVWFATRSYHDQTHDNIEITFLKFTAQEPEDWVFTVPNMCDNSSSLAMRDGLGDVNAVVYFANTNWNCADVACSSRVPSGSGQEGYACAEFTARALAAGAYLPGLTAYASAASYGSYKGYNLRLVTGLSNCLGAIGFKRQASSAAAVEAAYAVMGDGGEGAWSHACIGVSAAHVDCHNNARVDWPASGSFFNGVNAVWAP
jgi:hypothetical protein